MPALPAPSSLVPPHRPPRSGDVLFIGPKASVQFAGSRAIAFRVIRVDDRPTYDGWIWLDGFELNPQGEAFERRKIFVMVEGLLDWEAVRRAAALRRLEQEKAGSAGSVEAAGRRAARGRNSRLPGASAVRRVPVRR